MTNPGPKNPSQSCLELVYNMLYMWMLPKCQN